MAIFLHELKRGLKSLLIWGGSLALLIVIAVAKYAAFADNPASLAILDSMPKALMDSLNMSAFNLTTLSGFFGAMFTYFGLMGTIAAVLWGNDIAAREEREKTAEFSLVLPVSRAKLLTMKLLAALVNCAALVGITWAVSLLAIRAYPPEAGLERFIRNEMAAMFLLEMYFLMLGFLLGCALGKSQRGASIGLGAVLGAYFLFTISRMAESLDFLKFVTPFRYFDPAEMLSGGALKALPIILTGLFVSIFLLAAYFSYQRRDVFL
ncbi:MAG: ABC transporter permease subunit [Chloroflexi bacterium]|nr:ABC transporter permease subunit [Chloroflexota bacterium]